MVTLAIFLVAAAAAALPPVRSFWTVEETIGPQPVQVEVEAELVKRGRHLLVYREQGYRLTGEIQGEYSSEIEELVNTFDSVIYPQQVELFGPCPDRDGNDAVILLLTPKAGSGARFWRFDQMPDTQAQRYGFRSNEGEVLHAGLDHRGNHAVWNTHSVASAFHQLLHYSHDPLELDWSQLLGNYSGFLAGVAPARLLWGEADPDGRLHDPDDPWGPWGWSLLFTHYLKEKLGESALRELVAEQEQGFAALAALLQRHERQESPHELLADFAMACWLDDPKLAEGRFSFSTVTPPRPQPAATLAASRPISGQLTLGVGGMVYIVIEGSGDRSLPLSLQGDPQLSWIGRAIHRRQRGPDHELPLSFQKSAAAHLELPHLAAGDSVVVAALPLPHDPGGFEGREVVLQCGLGWVPRSARDPAPDELHERVVGALPDGGVAARGRLETLIARLVGDAKVGGAPVPGTRYAWAPEAAAVLTVLREEAARRGLTVEDQTFVRVAPAGVQQEWHNLVVELPGTDDRRWPVVIAAHWDAAHPRLEESYLRALNLHDNASGVAVVLEAAAALSRVQHRAPILAAFVAGGHHAAAGAEALFNALEGKVGAWIELDGVGIPQPAPRHLEVRLSMSERPLQLTAAFVDALRDVGLVPRTSNQGIPLHSGAPLAMSRGVPFLVLQTRTPVPSQYAIPVAVERQQASPDLMVLLAKALARATLQLAGSA